MFQGLRTVIYGIAVLQVSKINFTSAAFDQKGILFYKIH